MAAKFELFVDEDHSKLPTLYWLPKRPYTSRFIADSSAYTTTELSILLTSCLTVIKKHVIKYCTTVYERNGKNLCWTIKKSGEILKKLKSRGFLASCLSEYFLWASLPFHPLLFLFLSFLFFFCCHFFDIFCRFFLLLLFFFVF